MDSRLTPDLIEDILADQPLAPLPRSITPAVLARIQTSARPQLVTWNDIAISAVLAASLVAVWFTYVNLPPIVVAKLRIQGILLYQDFLVNQRWLVPSLFFGVATLLAALTIPPLLRMTTDDGR